MDGRTSTTAAELIEALGKVDPETEVVLTVHELLTGQDAGYTRSHSGPITSSSMYGGKLTLKSEHPR